MSSHSPQTAAPSHQPRDVSIDYLRACVTVLVLVLHCAAPYTHEAKNFEPAVWISPFPVIDRAMSLVCDYLMALTDAVVMPLMFFISGLFMDAGLRRRGPAAYLWARLQRLGAPYLAMASLLMPLAYGASWGLAHPGQPLLRFWLVDAKAGVMIGPGWFLWLLFFFECVVAALFTMVGGWVPRMAGWLRSFAGRPALGALLLLVLGWLLYVPMYLHFYNFWMFIKVLALPLQPARVLLYAAWLVAGFLVGSAGLDEGLLARRKGLAAHWVGWAVLAVVTPNVLWVGMRLSWLLGVPERAGRVAYAVAWVLADTTLCLGLLAVFRARVVRRRIWADSLARHAYGIYAMHYVFVLWVARLLLPFRAPAPLKFGVCFVLVLGLSWGASAVWLRAYAWLKREVAAVGFSHVPRSLAVSRRA